MTRYTPNWLQQGSYPAALDRRLLGALWPAAASTGCAVTVSTAMTVNIAAGQVNVPTGNNTGSVLCTSDATEQVTLAAAPASGTNRWDLIICQARGNDLDGGNNNDFIFTGITGVAASSNPAVPATPANAVALAAILIPGASAAVTAGNISDVRPGALSANSPVTPRGVLFVWAPTALWTGGAYWSDPVPGSSFTFTISTNRRIRTAMSMQSGKDATGAILTPGFRMDGNSLTLNSNIGGNTVMTWTAHHDWLVSPGSHTASFIGYCTAGAWNIAGAPGGLGSQFTVEDIGSW